jgi:alkylhydroperoxidase family enzyme
MDHHIRLASTVGVTPEILERVRTGPTAEGWSAKHRALLAAADELVESRDLDDATWGALALHYDARSLIEIVLRINQYEGLAATITALRVQRHHV